MRYQDAHTCGAVLSDDPGSDLFEQLLPASIELREKENVHKHVLAIAIMDLHNNYCQVLTQDNQTATLILVMPTRAKLGLQGQIP